MAYDHRMITSPQPSTQHLSGSDLWGLLFLVLLVSATLLPTLIANGWPQNHEFLGFFERTEVYAHHLSAGDWFPIWASSDNLGLGSPFPALYHKLFYLVSGFVFIICGDLKFSILLSLGLWLCIGGIGMFYLCRALSCPKWIAWCGAFMLVVANYTITDWLIRGAMAELSAMMLVPWIFSFFIRWIAGCSKQKNYFYFLCVVLGLSFLAHSVLTFYVVLMLIVNAIWIAIQKPSRFWPQPWKPLILGVGLLTLITGPYLWAMGVLGTDYALDRLLLPTFLPEHNLKPGLAFFWYPHWIWGKAWDSLTVQLDLPVLFLLLWSASLFVAKRFRPLQQSGQANPTIVMSLTAYLIIAASCALLFFLQTSWALPFYEMVPGAAYIQFPWRLLAILTPLLIALSLGLASWHSNLITNFVIVGAVLSMIVLCGAWASQSYPNISTQSTSFNNGLFGFNGSYIPKVVPIQRGEPHVIANLPDEDRMLLTNIHTQVANQLLVQNCTLLQAQGNLLESLTRHYQLSCQEPGLVPLPLFMSSWHRILIERINPASKQHSQCIVSKRIAGVCFVAIPEPGQYNITVEFPRLWPSMTRTLIQ